MSDKKFNKWSAFPFFLMGALCFGGFVYLVSLFWIGPTWDVILGAAYTDKGNIMYHDPMCFLFASGFALIGAFSILRGCYWGDRFAK